MAVRCCSCGLVCGQWSCYAGGVSVPLGGWRVRWWVVDWGGVMRVWRGEVALSVQDLMCDGCRGVAVDGEPGRMLGSA